METVAAGLTVRFVILFIAATLFQAAGTLMLGKTEGWTNPAWSVPCFIAYAISFWALGTLFHEGGPLSIIVPLFAAATPMLIMAIAVAFLGEPASFSRLGLLTFACVIIGIAGAM